MSEQIAATENASPNSAHAGSASGKWTVIGMFGFAILMIGLLFTYWHFYTAPFRTLQYAIADEYPRSSPRIVGGQHKSHKDQFPKILRIVVYVQPDDFDPEEAVEKSEQRAAELVTLAFAHQDVDQYQELQIVLLQRIPEGARKRWVSMKKVTEWRELLGSSSQM